MELGPLMSRSLLLAHRWVLTSEEGISESLVRGFIRPAVRAVPSSMARRLGPCRISLPEQSEAGVASRWIATASALEISIPPLESEEHDVAMELLTCLGQ